VSRRSESHDPNIGDLIILFASELARRHPDILSIAVHPGAVDSGLYGHTKIACQPPKENSGLQ
jgi:hypothetical protein